MPRRVFLDVGAHKGQTLAAVLALSPGFDAIVCFEPVPQHWPALAKLAGARARIERFGLWNRDVRATVYDPGREGAGLWLKDKRKATLRGGAAPTAACDFRRASDWFRANVDADDVVYLKLNCEGCECDIVDDLLDSGEFAKVAYVMVDFDARKIEALRHRVDETRARLAAYPAPRVCYSKQIMHGPTHAARIRNWLTATGALA